MLGWSQAKVADAEWGRHSFTVDDLLRISAWFEESVVALMYPKPAIDSIAVGGGVVPNNRYILDFFTSPRTSVLGRYVTDSERLSYQSELRGDVPWIDSRTVGRHSPGDRLAHILELISDIFPVPKTVKTEADLKMIRDTRERQDAFFEAVVAESPWVKEFVDVFVEMYEAGELPGIDSRNSRNEEE